MRLVTTLALTGLLLGSAAFAATPSAMTPAAAAPVTSAKAAPQMDCRAEAKAKNLKGTEKDKFMKDCKASTKH